MHFLTGEPLEYTIALIKPDAVTAGTAGRIITRMEHNFFVADVRCAQWGPNVAMEFYEEHRGKAFFDDLVRFMCSDRLYMITLVAPDAIDKWRAMMGATNPLNAMPGSIRGDFAARDGIIMHNCVHGSDSEESVRRESAVLTRHGYSLPEARRLCLQYRDLAWSIDEKGVPQLKRCR